MDSEIDWDSVLVDPPSPLNFNINLVLSRLSSFINTSSIPSTSVLLAHFSQLLAVPALTRIVADATRPILLDLCARWLHDDTIEQVGRLEAFCYLVGVHQEVYPILFEFIQQPSLRGGPLPSDSLSSLPPTHLHRILLIYYRILSVAPLLPTRLHWPLSHLSSLLQSHPDRGVRLLAIHCFSLQAGMAEVQRMRLVTEYLGEPGEEDCPIHFGEKLGDGQVASVEIDGWLLPVLETQRICDWRDSLVKPIEFFDSVPHFSEADLCPHITSIEGILLFRSTVDPVPPSALVSTPSAKVALRNLALHISQRLPTLLTSEPSAGKSMLISHVSDHLYPSSENHVIQIYLSDTSIDAKSLLGSFVSSPTKPGVFEWIDGIVIRALKEGKWLVLEDIDKASQEVLGMLLPLVESLGPTKRPGSRAFINVPGRGKVEAIEGFALLATRSVLHIRASRGFPNTTFLGHQHWSEIVVSSPSISEQESILSTRFPRLAGAPIKALLNVWDSARGIEAGFGNKNREITFRDMEKWVTRVESLLPPSFRVPNLPTVDQDVLSTIFPNLSLREDIFLEANSVFFASSPSVKHSSPIPFLISRHLGLTPDRTQWLLERRAPEFEIGKSPKDGRVTSVLVGRTRLNARIASSDAEMPNLTSPRPFALHRPSLLLLEELALCTSFTEPALLVGETGTGKTSTIQHLASLLSHPLTVLNLSNQSEAVDLLGGFKPVDIRTVGSDLNERFLRLFGASFNLRKNGEFVDGIRKAMEGGKWKRVVGLWREARRKVMERISLSQIEDAPETATPRKRRKIDVNASFATSSDWSSFDREVTNFEAQHVVGKTKFAFSFVEGPLIKALRHGYWVLLDEINLAAPETLEAILPLLQSPTSSITLTELGTSTPILRHPSFRLFASMNPATDVGKRDLPENLRSRFTEVWVPPPDTDREALLSIIQQYIAHIALSDRSAILDVAEFYESVRKLAENRTIADGSNKKPHFSMRTLTRALMFTADVVSSFGLRRALWEGCLMSFTMMLDDKSANIVKPLAEKYLLARIKNIKALLSQIPGLPPGATSKEAFVQIGPFWILKGERPLEAPNDYILTPSVQTKLVNLSRIIMARRFPVLIEGPTSSGKTSAVEYLARRTGHRFVRINNHEHTDIQEYIGTYVSDPETGKLLFQDGILVRALRRGDWIVLDELNLAPTDVLEALNRLLDDNRELFIPETEEIVRPHPHFMLFATQNPPGLYGGRKVLSRAFRNRFLEVHFEDVPQVELETILCDRCQIAPSYGQRIVSVFRELQQRRQAGRVFESKQGFATLRDLFRWAKRDAIGYQQLAENGYMLLAERTRRADDKAVVKEVIESVMKVHIEESAMYNFVDNSAPVPLGDLSSLFSEVVWTSATQRLYVLVTNALRNDEPVLLVGETGSGKTSVCELLTRALGKRLHTVNCHQNTETADLLGSQRPVRSRTVKNLEVLTEARGVFGLCGIDAPPPGALNADDYVHLIDQILSNQSLSAAHTESLRQFRRKLQRIDPLFEWHDGPLVEAMRRGDIFLLDEISLADDSVLERLNSVLEPSRALVLAEKGGWDFEHVQVVASPGFELLATMNPGGDYGKKELSPALRNRFTEIWVPQIENHEDRLRILRGMWRHDVLSKYSDHLLEFCSWFGMTVGDANVVGLRDILTWIKFSNDVWHRSGKFLTTECIFHHAAHMTLLDGLGSLPRTSTLSTEELCHLRSLCLRKLDQLVPLTPDDYDIFMSRAISADEDFLAIGSFRVEKGSNGSVFPEFFLAAPTTAMNAMRVMRACELSKPILLEGSPGVGKTSLVTALANATGHQLCRINLSDQTDMMDLLGADLPVEGGKPGEFIWKDAAFLSALQDGGWVLLDEMNLAPQAVLEGLNAVLDHRGTVYIPELCRSFTRHPTFRIFAAQNPTEQGGGRKGLPKSFLNRFTKVFLDELPQNDLLLICRHLFPRIPQAELHTMITFTTRLHEEVMNKRTFGQCGSPWEFNLRDVFRWGTLLSSSSGLGTGYAASEHLRALYLCRFRRDDDREHAAELFEDVSGKSLSEWAFNPWSSSSSEYTQFGHSLIRNNLRAGPSSGARILHSHLVSLEAASSCLEHGWLVILTGPSGSGKTSMVRYLGEVAGQQLQEFSVSSATDTTDLLGTFEQVHSDTHLWSTISRLSALVERSQHLSDITRAETLVSLGLAWDNLKNSLLGIRSFAAQVRAVAITVSALDAEFAAESPAILATLNSFGAAEGPSHFEWINGPLIEAMESGAWFLLDNANLCDPSVLDRLNPLCETGGALVLSERGPVNGRIHVVRPHPNFKLIMTVDPVHGELSRAMRNRGVELAMSTILNTRDRIHLQLEASASPRLLTNRKVRLDRVSVLSQLNRRALFYGSDSCLARSVEYANCPVQPKAPLAFDIWPGCNLASPDSRPSAEAFGSLWLRTVSLTSPGITRRLGGLFDDQSKPPSHMHLASLSVALTSHPLVEQFKAAREDVLKKRGVPLLFLLAQPMDLCLNSVLVLSGSRDENGRKQQFMKLSQALDLFVRVYMDEQPEMSFEDRKYVSLDNSEDPTMENYRSTGIFPLIAAARSTAFEVLQLPLFTSEDENLNVLRLAMDLLDYGHILHRMISPSHFDYSGVICVSQWFSDTLKGNNSAIFSHVATRASLLSASLNRLNGRGMMTIWKLLLSTAFGMGYSETFSRIDKLCARLNLAYAQMRATRSHAVDVIALASLEPFQVDHRDDLHNLTADLESHVQDLRNSVSSTGPETDDTVIVALAELDMLCAFHLDAGHSRRKAQVVLDMACLTPAYPLLRLATIQKAFWAMQSADDFSFSCPSALVLQISWLNSLWSERLCTFDPPALDGPAVLFRPTMLGNLLKLYIARPSLGKISASEARLDRMTVFTSHECDTHLTYTESTTNVLFQSIATLCFMFRDSFSMDPSPVLGLGSATASKVNALATFLLSAKDVECSRTICRHLLPLTESYDTSDELLWLGHAWISAFRLIMELYLPTVPIDPVAIQLCRLQFWRGKEARLRDQLLLLLRMEEHVTGNSTNLLIQQTKESLDATISQLADVELPSVPRKPDVSRLRALFVEINQFSEQVIPALSLEPFLDGSWTKYGIQMLEKEQLMQESIANFLHRLSTTYPDYSDIVQPISWALLHLRFGLRVFAVAKERSTFVGRKDVQSISECLVMFPTVLCASTLAETTSRAVWKYTSASIPPATWSALELMAITFEVECGVEISNRMEAIQTIYESFFGLWNLDRTRRAKEAEETQSIYRRRKVDEEVLNDQEADEREFRELFPDFEESSDDHPFQDPSSSHQCFPRDLLNILRQAHLSLFGASPQGPQKPSFQNQRNRVVEKFVLTNLTGLPEYLDGASLGYRISLLSDMYKRRQPQSSAHGERPYDFYNDPNVVETRKAASLLEALTSHVGRLIEVWPDQMVLQNIQNRCSDILKLVSDSSVAKVLSALEHLLMDTEEWENYANRDNSLKAHQSMLSALIVEWRRLELSHWPHLLETQAIVFSEGVSEWWFTLYEAGIAGTLASFASSGTIGTSAHLMQLVPLIDQFIQSAPIGQFDARLHLLESFARLTFSMAETRDVDTAEPLFRAGRIFHSTCALFSVFRDKVTQSMKQQREVLEKEIRDFVKLASWKDVNVHALKQSAQRTHRHLHRCIRKFRDILRQPVTPLLVFFSDNGGKDHTESLTLPDRQSQESLAVLPRDLGNPSFQNFEGLAKILTRFRAILDKVGPDLQLRSPSSLDVLASEVITRAHSLAASSPSGAKLSRAKAENLLLMRKRKAWVDLMKELKRLGLTANLKPEVLDHQYSRLWLMELEAPITLQDSLVDHVVVKSERYHNRLVTSMSALRASLSNHKADISTRELQRAAMYVESSLQCSLRGRSILAQAQKASHQLTAITTRLGMIDRAETSISFLGIALSRNVAFVYDSLCRCASSLREIIGECENYITITSGQSLVSDGAFDKLKALLTQTQTVLEKLAIVRDNVKLTRVGLLLTTEKTIVDEAVGHIRSAARSLRELAETDPRARHLFDPVSRWLDSLSFQERTPSESTELRAIPRCCQEVIDTLLISAQALLDRRTDDTSTDDDMDDGFVKKKSASLQDLWTRFAPHRIIDKIEGLFDSLAAHSSPSSSDFSSHQETLLCVYPFLSVYVAALENFVIENANWTCACMKFTYVICSTVHTVAEKGFCKPPESEESESREQEGKQMEDGTGLGEGRGAEDVSNQIEDESQVEGLKGEEVNDQEQDGSGQDTEAIEMDEDISGNLEDVEKEGDGNENEEEKESEEEPEPDETMGDLDPFASDTIDEKLWGDEHGPEDDRPQQSTDQDHSKQKSSDSDVVAKQTECSDQKPSESEVDGEEDDKEKGENDEDLPDLDDSRPELGAKMDEYIPEADTLDLPDDLDLGQDGQDGSKDEDDLDMNSNEDDEATPMQEDAEIDDVRDMEDVVEPNGTEESKVDEGELEHSNEDTEGADPATTSRPDVGGGNDGADDAAPEEGSQNQEYLKGEGVAGNGEQAPADGSVDASKEVPEHKNKLDSQQQQSSQSLGDEDWGNERSPSNALPVSGNQPATPSPAAAANPLRSMGDALKQFRRQFEEIRERTDPHDLKSKDHFPMPNETSEVEYLADGEGAEDHDMQALGPAGEEEVSKLRDLNLDDNEGPTAEADSGDAMDIDEDKSSGLPPSEPQEQHFPISGSVDKDSLEGAVTREQIQPTENALPRDPATSPRTTKDTEEFSSQIELRLRQWQQSPHQSLSTAQDIWHQYTSLTSHLSSTLSEQLRLILEPTLSSRLRGDYRSGKRLNMKKIIPYIASEFKKDKIWMRRTKPSKREYQILIALDDSKSMKESRSVHLSFLTLALIVNALHKLEVGEVGVVGFGERVEVIRAFDETPREGGAEILRNLSFDQGRTDVLGLLERSVEVLGEQREKKRNGDKELWQLELIISDGICQDHEKLKSLLRKAVEMRIMIVFVIVDSLHQSSRVTSSAPATSSILSMKHASYKMAEGGKMEVVMERYLDTFPFEYYVVLRDVNDLPDVLSGTLRQFFERVVEE